MVNERVRHSKIRLWPNGHGLSLQTEPPEGSGVYFSEVAFGHKLKDPNTTATPGTELREKDATLWVYEVHKDLNTVRRKPTKKELENLLDSAREHQPDSKFTRQLEAIVSQDQN